MNSGILFEQQAIIWEDRAIRSMFLRDVKSTICPSRILQQKKYGKKLHSIRRHDEVEGLVQKET